MIVSIPLSIEYDKVNSNGFKISKEIFSIGVKKCLKEFIDKGVCYIEKGSPKDVLAKKKENHYIVALRSEFLWGTIKNIDIENKNAEVEIFDLEKENFLKIKNPEIVFYYSVDYELKDNIIEIRDILTMKPYLQSNVESVYKDLK